MGEGPVLTIAGAGTGKTKTLASRVAWLVSQGIDPGRIMLLTFTRRASDEMLRRARRALGESGSRTLGTVWGGTFHSVANRLLRTYGEAIGLDSDFTVMDQSDAEDLMDASRHNLAFGSKEKRFPRKQTCLSIYSRCVNSSDRLDHTLAAFFPWCIEWEQGLRLLFKSYTEAKQERHVLDYDDLLLYWFHLLGDETLVTLLNERFDHILVDEYQDTNRLQSSILHRMRSRPHRHHRRQAVRHPRRRRRHRPARIREARENAVKAGVAEKGNFAMTEGSLPMAPAFMQARNSVFKREDAEVEGGAYRRGRQVKYRDGSLVD